MKKIAAAFAVASSVMMVTGCEDFAVDIVDRVVEVDEQQYHWFSFETGSASRFEIEYQHYSGTPMIVYTMDEADFYRFKNGQRFNYYTKLSSSVSSGTFNTGEVHFNGSGTRYVVAKAKDVSDGYWTTASGKLRITERPFADMS